MCPFDLESTGVDVETARIVTGCVAHVGHPEPNQKSDIRSWLLAVDIPIPESATAIHGITTEKAQADGVAPIEALEEIAWNLHYALDSGYPIVGMNLPYDLTLLDRECRRWGVDTLTARLSGKPIAPVVDVYVLDKHVDRYRKGSRKLDAMCAHYGALTGEVHNATDDALAAARVAWKIARAYPEIGSMSLAELHDAQVEWAAEQAASFREYRASRGESVDGIDGRWPIRPIAEEVPA